MKRTGYLKEQIVNLDNLYDAYYKACRGKHWKKEVLEFAENLDDNIRSLREGLIDGTTSMGNYHYFTIRDPKERIICAASFRERITHHAIINVCQPYFDRTLIDSTYATGRSKKRFRTKFLKYERLFNDGTWTESVYQEHALPLLSFVQHAESKAFRKACLQIHTKGGNQRVALTG